MQFPSNTFLAAALTPGMGVDGEGKRRFGMTLMVDWLKDGLFDDPNSDMSKVVASVSIDRELAQTFPDPMQVTDGNVAAQLQITLEGDLADGTPVWKAFSPYSGYYLGGIADQGPTVYFELVVQTQNGPVNIRQFTGMVTDCLPSKAAGNVIMTCYDSSQILTQPVTMPTWAADQTILGLGTADSGDVGSICTSWVIEELLRKGAYYQGPQWHPEVVCAWTMNGAGLPSVGTIGIEDPQVTEPTLGPPYNYYFGYGVYNRPHMAPAGAPASVYGPGKFGNTCFLGQAHLGPIGITRSFVYLSGNAHTTFQNVATNYGSHNSNLLGFGAWFFIDPSEATTPSTMTYYLSEAQFNYAGSNQDPAFATIAVNHQTGAIGLTVRNEGYTKVWSLNATAGTGWHYLYAVVQFTPSAVNLSIWDTGTQLASGNGGLAAPMDTIMYSFQPTNTNLCQFQIFGPAQYGQMWYQFDTALSGLTQPFFTVSGKTAEIDQGLTRLWQLPDINGADLWSTLKAVVGAELGAIYADEFGAVHFDNRVTISGRQTTAASVNTYDLDSLYDIAPESNLSTVANIISWSTKRRAAVPYSTIYATQQPDQFQVPPLATLSYTVTNNDVQSIKLGGVRYHPQAQGYANTAEPTEPGGGGPSGGFTYKDWMQIYGPAYWYNGYTAYQQGSSAADTQPVAGTGINVLIEINGQDSRSMQLVMVSTNASQTLEFAVDDNTPFLHVGGTIVQDYSTASPMIEDAPSIAAYQPRVLSIPSSDWLQDPNTTTTLFGLLLLDTKQPQPYIQDVSIVGDPRLQLQDVIKLVDDDEESIGAAIYGSLVGIKRTISLSDGVKDSITLRTF